MAKPATVDEYVAQVDAAVRPLFAATRAFVLKHAPTLEERLYMGVPSYQGARKGGVFYLADHSKHVNLGFVGGARVPDPDGLLEGTGKSLRHVKLRGVEDLSPRLARLVKAAVKADKAEGRTGSRQA